VLGGGVRASRALAGATGVDRALDAAAEEAIVRALESPAVERAIVRLAEEGRLAEVLETAAASLGTEELVSRAIESEAADRIWAEILASDKAQMLVERVAEAPEVRAAIAQQGFGLISDIGRAVSRLTEAVDDVLERIAHHLLGRGDAEREAEEVGLITRFVAFAVDAALAIGLLSLISGVLASIIPFAFGSGGGLPAWAIALVTAAGLGVAGTFFVTFWYLVGQTPGMRFLGIRLVGVGGAPLTFRMAVRRLFAIPLALLPLGLGFLAILVSPQRRGWHDRISRTVVVYDVSSAPWSVTGAAMPEGHRRHGHPGHR
jgi:uncharacterized RDD family membrane protein YckC